MYRVVEKSTQHGLKTPHGMGVPHRLPQDERLNTSNILSTLTQQLYPTGRAFHMPEEGDFKNLHKGINVSFIRLIKAAKLLIDKTLPDNINFEEQDATLWEYRLGLYINPFTDLENRKSAIKRKIAYPSNIQPRQHPLFIQSQLRLAGFPVTLYENRFFEDGNYVYKTPDEIAAASPENTQHGDETQHGQGTQHGTISFEVIANQLSPNENYSIGGDDNLWCTFFIGGDALGENIIIDESRQEEFRELVLKLKPAHTVAFLFIKFL